MSKSLKLFFARRPTVSGFIYWPVITVLLFSILGLVWSVPVPHFTFLDKMNGYINLATLLIAAVMVYFLRQSIRQAFFAGIVICIFSAGIISLEKLERIAGWPSMGSVCLGLFLVSGILALLLIHKNK